MRAGQAASRGGLEPVVLHEVDGEPLHREQLLDARHSSLERVGERQLRDCLPDDRQQRLRALELVGERPAALACTEGVRRPHSEGGQARQERPVGVGLFGEDQLQGPERRLAELKGRKPARPVL